jgi:hypothetical protein
MSEICILFLKQIVLAVANILSMNVQNMYTALEADCSCNGNAPMYVIYCNTVKSSTMHIVYNQNSSSNIHEIAYSSISQHSKHNMKLCSYQNSTAMSLYINIEIQY